MKNIDNLKKLKNELILLTYLASIGVGIIGNNVSVKANENIEIIEQEGTEVSNENNKCETYEEKITYYSNVYGIKESFVHDYMDYMLNECEDNKDFLKMNQDLQIITAARYIYNSDDYDAEEKSNHKNYIVTLTPEELILKYAPIFEVNKDIPHTIACVECTEPIIDDWNYRTNGNMAGIGGDMYLGNGEMGVIYYLDMLHNNYGITEDTGNEIFEKIAKIYCPPNWQSWTSMANDIYSETKDDYFARASKELKNKYKYNENTKTYELKPTNPYYGKH